MEIYFEGQDFRYKSTTNFTEGTRIDALDFTQPKGREDAAFIVVEGRTPICQLVGDSTYTDKPVWGKGVLVIKPYNKETFVQRFDEIEYDEFGVACTPVYVYHPGDFYCWIGDLVVFGTSDPAYNENQENQYKLNDPAVPVDFNEAVKDELKKQTK